MERNTKIYLGLIIGWFVLMGILQITSNESLGLLVNITIFIIIIFLAVWRSINKVNLPSSNEDEPQSADQKTIRILLSVITGIYALMIVPACLFAMLSLSAFEGAGSLLENLLVFLFMATFPITIIVSVISAWKLHKRKNIGNALGVILLPVVQLAVSYFVPGLWHAR